MLKNSYLLESVSFGHFPVCVIASNPHRCTAVLSSTVAAGAFGASDPVSPAILCREFSHDCRYSTSARCVISGDQRAGLSQSQFPADRSVHTESREVFVTHLAAQVALPDRPCAPISRRGEVVAVGRGGLTVYLLLPVLPPVLLLPPADLATAAAPSLSSLPPAPGDTIYLAHIHGRCHVTTSRVSERGSGDTGQPPSVGTPSSRSDSAAQLAVLVAGAGNWLSG